MNMTEPQLVEILDQQLDLGVIDQGEHDFLVRLCTNRFTMRLKIDSLHSFFSDPRFAANPFDQLTAL
jgi:hypothetical protein